MAIIYRTDPRLVFVPIEEAIEPPTGAREREVIRDSWWVVDPDGQLIYYQSKLATGYRFVPQCNAIEGVTRFVVERIYPWAKVRFIERVFRKVHPQDHPG